MVILEKPYISDLMLEYLSQCNIPVLDNEFARECSKRFQLNLLTDEKMKTDFMKNGKLYTTSENALDWLYKNFPGHDLVKKISILKDKVKFREMLRPMYPNFFYKEVTEAELEKMQGKDLKMPFVLKPAIGFLSLGVYTIYNAQNFEAARIHIRENKKSWTANFPKSVIGDSKYILEQYIFGTEYAIDAYYNDIGKPVILNIFTHKFASDTDVSDRVYYTSKKIINTFKQPFEQFLAEANQYFQLKNIPMHVEVRVDGATVCPIEFNPMRFAGLSTTDVAYHAYGIRTIEYFLQNREPDFSKILKGKDGILYSLVLLDKPDKSIPCSVFNYNKVYNSFETVLELRKVDNPNLDIFGFVFTKTRQENEHELDYILKSSLREFCEC
ncbi:MAG TPA: ATP-grasp domain-containing protein [Firmicutes bacterium]|jgi:hypothetical protein|nr:ATP-grasp domain-containing protein [Bacillota bacterium]